MIRGTVEKHHQKFEDVFMKIWKGYGPRDAHLVFRKIDRAINRNNGLLLALPRTYVELERVISRD